MIHFKPTDGHLPQNDRSIEDIRRYREIFAEVEALGSLVRKARRTANESLMRANEAPEPHATSNNIFAMLYETHWRDREALFDAMRRLDAARETLRLLAVDKATGQQNTMLSFGRRGGRKQG